MSTDLTDVELKEAEDEYAEAREEIAQHIDDSCVRRAALAREGSIRQVMAVLSAEMALAGAFGQIDVVRRLGEMAENLAHSEATLTVRAREDYQRRFGDDLDDETHSALRR
jgi:hypothetical protein